MSIERGASGTAVWFGLRLEARREGGLNYGPGRGNFILSEGRRCFLGGGGAGKVCAALLLR